MSVAAARRKREKEARREAILRAADEVIARTGARHLTMDEVARAAELSKGTLYLYFAGKDALFAAVAERNISEKLPALRAAVEAAEDGLGEVVALHDAWHVELSRTPHVFRFMIEWFLEPRIDDRSEAFQRYRARVRETIGLLVRALERGQRDGSIRADIDTTHHAMHIWSSTLGVMLMHRNAESVSKRISLPVELGRLPDLHRDMLRRTLAPSAARPLAEEVAS